MRRVAFPAATRVELDPMMRTRWEAELVEDTVARMRPCGAHSVSNPSSKNLPAILMTLAERGNDRFMGTRAGLDQIFFAALSSRRRGPVESLGVSWPLNI